MADDQTIRTNHNFWGSLLLITACVISAISFQWVAVGDFPLTLFDFSDAILLITDSGLLFLSYRIVRQLFVPSRNHLLQNTLIFLVSLIPGVGIIIFYRWVILFAKLMMLAQSH